MKVFISYTSKDKEINTKLFNKIVSSNKLNGINIFIDKLHNHDPNPQQRIEKEIQNSNIVMILLSDNVFHSKWVQKEINLAREYKIPIISEHPEMAINRIKTVYNNMYDSISTPSS